MRIAAALLCDFAQVREGLLFMASAGITRVLRDSLPAPLNACVALHLQVGPSERLFPHEVALRVVAPSGREIVRVNAGLQVGPDGDLDSDESALLPMAFDIRAAGVDEYGWHRVDISVDSEPAADALRFKVARRPPPRGAAVTMPVGPRAPRRH